ncbi:MAG: hypothetical protein HUJ54_13985 [Erysipelotrichaceae bacterium]|nr:hypothetical protein [Erysipelotrichaceae bacterium]
MNKPLMKGAAGLLAAAAIAVSCAAPVCAYEKIFPLWAPDFIPYGDHEPISVTNLEVGGEYIADNSVKDKQLSLYDHTDRTHLRIDRLYETSWFIFWNRNKMDFTDLDTNIKYEDYCTNVFTFFEYDPEIGMGIDPSWYNLPF